MLDEISKKISDKIANNTNADKNQSDVIHYGVMAIIHITVFIALISVLGIIFNTFMPILTICLSAAFFRQNSGGAHAESSLLCTSIGCVVCLLLSLFCKTLVGWNIPLYAYIIFAAVSVFLAVLATVFLVPVDTPNKPIKSEKKKKRMKRNSYIILFIYLGLLVVALFLGRSNVEWFLFLVCMCFGILWQTFMLTKIGGRFLSLIQAPFLKISSAIKRKPRN